MGHANIYIRKDNEVTWNGITHKSLWVNEQLDKKHPLSGMPDVFKSPTPKAIPETNDYKPRLDKAILNHIAPKGLCKIHGVPLTDRGRCLQKGCKYA